MKYLKEKRRSPFLVSPWERYLLLRTGIHNLLSTPWCSLAIFLCAWVSFLHNIMSFPFSSRVRCWCLFLLFPSLSSLFIQKTPLFLLCNSLSYLDHPTAICTLLESVPLPSTKTRSHSKKLTYCLNLYLSSNIYIYLFPSTGFWAYYCLAHLLTLFWSKSSFNFRHDLLIQ